LATYVTPTTAMYTLGYTCNTYNSIVHTWLRMSHLQQQCAHLATFTSCISTHANVNFWPYLIFCHHIFSRPSRATRFKVNEQEDNWKLSWL